jgi:serine/threonine protein kinase
MGKVYKVHNTTDPVEAMKMVLTRFNNDPELAERFKREIRVMAALENPNIRRPNLHHHGTRYY